mgnify:CR=1 FL=1
MRLQFYIFASNFTNKTPKILKNFTEHQISRANIKNIIFDLGAVIINIDLQLTATALKQLINPTFESQKDDLVQKAYKAPFFIEYELGKIDDATFCQRLRDEFHLEANDDQIVAAWNTLLLDIPAERIELLHNLRKTHRTFILSNTNTIHIKEVNQILHKSHQIATCDDLVEKAYYSHIMHKRKPWPEIYQQVIDENGLDPTETLFIDDNEANIKAANSVGLQGLLVVPNLNGSVQFFSEITV